MKKSLLILLSFVLFSVSVKANDYVVNDFAIDQMFAQAEQISMTIADINTLAMQQELNALRVDGICGLLHILLALVFMRVSSFISRIFRSFYFLPMC